MHFKSSLTILFFGATLSCCINKPKDENYIGYVDPFIGTDYHGHTYPGATLPFGMVQLSPDTRTSGWDGSSGYHYSDSVIFGFSHTHLSGTGIGDLGDILFLPFTEDLKTHSVKKDNIVFTGAGSVFQKNSEKASPGYYSVFLEDYDVNVELSATTRTGIHKYTYPENAKSGILIDLAHSINKQAILETWIKVVNDSTIEGFTHNRGWAYSQKVYFQARFSKPFGFELYSGGILVSDSSKITGTDIKAKLSFKTTKDEVVLVKVGISGVDAEGAAKNLDTENTGWNFDEVVARAENVWNKQLSKIKVTDRSVPNKTTFYTALYHASLAPTIFCDVDGRYRGMDHQIHQSNDPNYTVFSLWDTYRAEHPLLTIIDPELDQTLIRSLIHKYNDGGIMPMWELMSNYTGTMIGSHSIPVIVDAYMKGLNNFDTLKALEACMHAMSYDTLKSMHIPNPEARVKLITKAKKYDLQYGYIPSDLIIASVSQGLEYAYNNWCVATFAKSLGREDIAAEFYNRSQNYRAYFDSVTGFMRGKNANGSWHTPFDPRFSDHWNTPYVEGNAWQWNWYVPQDIDGLIGLFGGKENFAKKLDSLFTITSEIVGENKSLDISGLIGQYAHGNEPSHHTAYLFNYADMPWRTQELINKIRSDFYTDKPDGLCGNEDCGQMSAWYILNAMGFYPVCPGDTKYSIGIPLFSELEIPLSNGNTFKVLTRNRSPKNVYVERVLLDGKPLTTPFIDHSDIVAGKTLVFEMGSEPSIFWKQ